MLLFEVKRWALRHNEQLSELVIVNVMLVNQIEINIQTNKFLYIVTLTKMKEREKRHDRLQVTTCTIFYRKFFASSDMSALCNG